MHASLGSLYEGWQWSTKGPRRMALHCKDSEVAQRVKCITLYGNDGFGGEIGALGKQNVFVGYVHTV